MSNRVSSSLPRLWTWGALATTVLAACTPPNRPEPKLPLPATASCTPSSDRCAGAPAPAAPVADYRKDFFFPYEQYPEASIPDPKEGGRVQIVGTAAVSGTVQRVELDGVDLSTLYGEGGLDWYHVWPTEVLAGSPMWVAFHSRAPSLDTARQISIRVVTSSGDALSGTVTLQHSPVELVSLSSTSALDGFLLHLRNADTRPHTLGKLWLNGRDVTAQSCLPVPTLEPGATELVTAPLCTPARPGQPWTVVLEVADAPPVVASGRVLRPFFPIETWPSSGDCPFPGEQNGNFEEHVAHGIDTFFVHDNYSCPVSSGAEILAAFARTPGVYTLPTDDLLPEAGSDGHVAARFCGDEADGELKNARDVQACADRLWAETPELPTYIGGSRSRHNGAFAGTTDIQGMDFYVCDCAPHITDTGSFPPFRGAYDYAVANRKNHAPLPTWTYTQGFSGAWDVVAPTPGAIPNYRQVMPAEMRAEAMSVVAGGAKGLMYFQTQLEQAHQFPESWEELSRVNHDLLAVRDLLAVGGATGLATADDRTVLDAIRGPDALVVPVVSLAFVTDFAAPEDSAMHDVECAIGMNLHWQWAPHTTDIHVEIPADFTLSEVVELRNGAITTPALRLRDRMLTLPNVSFDEAAPARLFVLASSPDVVSRIRANVSP